MRDRLFIVVCCAVDTMATTTTTTTSVSLIFAQGAMLMAEVAAFNCQSNYLVDTACSRCSAER